MKISSKFGDAPLPQQADLVAFEHGSIWKYFFDALSFRIEGARDELENQSVDLDTLRINQGRVEELRFMRDFPQFLIDNYDALKAELDALKEIGEQDAK